MLNWNDYRYLLAVGSQGSLAAAARKLGVSQPTVGRRLAALAEALNVQLLDVHSDGARLSEAGQHVFEQARTLEQQAALIEVSARTLSENNFVRVRLAASEGFSRAVLVPLLAELQSTNPNILVDLIVGTKLALLRHDEADIALRLGDPTDEVLRGRKVGEVRFGLYAHETYFAKAAPPSSVEDLNTHTIIESTGEIADLPQARWLRTAASEARVALSASSVVNQIDALVAGMGVVTLPTYLARGLPGVQQLLKKEFAMTVDVWLLSQPNPKSPKVVRTVLDYLAQQIPRRLKRLHS